MDTKRKRQEVVDLINNLKEHSDRLDEQVNIPELELNVFLSKISKLYEKAAVLKHLVSKENRQRDEIVENNYNPSKKVDTKDFDHSKEKAEPNQVNEHDDLIPKARAEEQQNIDLGKEESVKQPTVPNQGTDNTNVDQKIIGKLEDYIDVNSRFSQHEDPSLSHQLKKQPIANLMTAIGLNERYLFANQLFNGDMERFIAEVKKLNSFDSEEEAMDYFDDDLVRNNKWDSNDDLVAGFRLLVERRFNQ